jgi:hypothetical protein
LLNDENVRRLISDYENINNVNTSKPNNTNTHKLNNEIILKGIEVIAQKDFQDYLVDGAEAINSMVKIIGEEKAATAILITQFATQGIVKTSVSMLLEEGKDTLFGGVKDKISNYISKDLFEVNDKGWQDKQKEAIYSLSDVSADFSIDLALSGPFALMKGAKNLGKANKKFDESLKENNVNSDTIAKSNAELKSNEHNLNNKNSSDGVGKNGIQKLNNNDNTMIATSKGVIVLSKTLAKQGSSNLVGDFTKLEGATVDEIISRVPKDWKMLAQDYGKRIKFIDENGAERIRIHAPSENPKLDSSLNTKQGWILRIQDTSGNYLDNFGNIGGRKENRTHIPIYGNLNAVKGT